jgi:hypothetical protein
MAEAARRPIEALAAGQVTPSEAESVLKLLEALGALLNQKGSFAGKFLIFHGEPGGTRTRDPLLKRQMLYRLSYRLLRRAFRFPA